MATTAPAAAAEGENKPVMVVGVDDSEHSHHALRWTLDHFFPSSAADPAFKLVIVHAKPATSSVVGLAGPGSADVLPFADSSLRKIAARVIDNARELCRSKSVKDVHLEVVEGDARNVLCEAAEKHHADMLVVGSHGYGAFKRVVLGSVSDYCVHHVHCTVTIIKKPKHKN